MFLVNEYHMTVFILIIPAICIIGAYDSENSSFCFVLCVIYSNFVIKKLYENMGLWVELGYIIMDRDTAHEPAGNHAANQRHSKAVHGQCHGKEQYVKSGHKTNFDS